MTGPQHEKHRRSRTKMTPNHVRDQHCEPAKPSRHNQCESQRVVRVVFSYL